MDNVSDFRQVPIPDCRGTVEFFLMFLKFRTYSTYSFEFNSVFFFWNPYFYRKRDAKNVQSGIKLFLFYYKLQCDKNAKV